MLVAAGEAGVAVERLIDVLWPNPEEGGRKAFDITLHRLRKLLGADGAVVVTDARAALDPRIVSTDAWTLLRVLDAVVPSSGSEPPPGALEAAASRVLTLYTGAFLEGDMESPWQVTLRNRLAGRFARFVQHLGARWEAAGQWRRAAELYQRAIELDPLAESFYRAHMVCLQAEGRRAEALEVFRRCRQMLSVMLGVPPAAETEAIHRQLTTPIPVDSGIDDP